VLHASALSLLMLYELLCYPLLSPFAATCSVRAPRAGGRDRAPEPYGLDAREFLRKKLIGKDVTVKMEYTRKIGMMPGQAAAAEAPAAPPGADVSMHSRVRVVLCMLRVQGSMSQRLGGTFSAVKQRACQQVLLDCSSDHAFICLVGCRFLLRVLIHLAVAPTLTHPRIGQAHMYTVGCRMSFGYTRAWLLHASIRIHGVSQPQPASHVHHRALLPCRTAL
jgi:hypothetical protein